MYLKRRLVKLKDMKKTETVFHIYAIVYGKKKYISAHMVRAADNRIIPQFDEDIEKAKEYSSEAHAQRIIKEKIFDNFDRKFKIESREVPVRRKRIKIFGDEI